MEEGLLRLEYKGKKKNLDEAYKQLLRYREALENPPLLVVCDFDRYIIRTNFNGTVQKTHEFTNAQIDDPQHLALLRAVFADPDFLKPQRTTAEVTESLAETIAEVAKSLQKREAQELADAQTRAEMNFAQRKHLRIARFLNRIVFCFFAEDTGLLPKHLFSELLKTGLDDPRHLAETLENLFAVMARGGSFGKDKIRHFNGHLFEESTVFELTEDEMRKLADAGEADWQFIQPSIMGTLFERALEPEQRSQLGAHYTSEADIKTLVEPVLMAPLRREWAELRSGRREPALISEQSRGRQSTSRDGADSRRRLRLRQNHEVQSGNVLEVLRVEGEQAEFPLDRLRRQPKVHDAKFLAPTLLAQLGGQVAEDFARVMVHSEQRLAAQAAHGSERFAAGGFIRDQFNAHLEFRHVDRGEEDRFGARHRVNVRWGQCAALDGHPNVRVNQEAHGLRNSWSDPRLRLPSLAMASVVATAAPAPSPSTPCKSPNTSKAVAGGGSGTMLATRRRWWVTTTSSPWVAIAAQALGKSLASVSYVSIFMGKA